MGSIIPAQLAKATIKATSLLPLHPDGTLLLPCKATRELEFVYPTSIGSHITAVAT
jgi:hypothetical protein